MLLTAAFWKIFFIIGRTSFETFSTDSLIVEITKVDEFYVTNVRESNPVTHQETFQI